MGLEQLYYRFTDIHQGLYGGISFKADIKDIMVMPSHTVITTATKGYLVKEGPRAIFAEMNRVHRFKMDQKGE
jgi:hypothetical protein